MKTSFINLLTLFFIFSSNLLAKENFLLVNVSTEEIIQQIGSEINERYSPCSTFKIALSLMGFDAGVLQDEHHPKWPFEAGYMDDLESWKGEQTPKTWMQRSCVWYSQLLSPIIGLGRIQEYLSQFQYGNQDMCGDEGKNNGLTRAWLSSSLQISPKEQVVFLQKLIKEELPITPYAMKMTKQLLLVEENSDWKLFGKTGLGKNVGWFVGWIEKQGQQYVFSYNIYDQSIDPAKRIPRVKQLLSECLSSADSMN